MFTCPLPSNKIWKQLVEIHGESKAKTIWIAYKGEIPSKFLTVVETSMRNTSLDNGLLWLKQIMPDVEPVLVDGLIDNIANGSYDLLNDLITLSKDYANKQVVKEEAFHRVFNLLPKTEQEKLLDEGSKKYGIARGKSTATVKYSQVDQNKVDFSLKAIKILQSDKAKEIFEKGIKNKWSLDKILTELQLPKEQKQLIIDNGKTNREDIITDLLANYSYAIEINTAKKQSGYNNNNIPFTYQKVSKNNYVIIDPSGDEIQDVNSEIEAKNKVIQLNKELEQELSRPTQYYSNLTVPGGTNYTEQEIATPGITPSIKGHAQFATDQGIGWFRSDDKGRTALTIIKDANKLPQRFNGVNGWIVENINNTWFTSLNGENREEIGSSEALSMYHAAEDAAIIPTNENKTRRILEVQSDLFQKGRDKEDLINKDFGDILPTSNGWALYAKGGGTPLMYFDTKEKAENYKNNTPVNNQNQFLQLLNKNNNWVTFFIKSIIQDSARNGYEKVLFPSGNTASKIEGHTTLEDFKIEKEKRLEYLKPLLEKSNTISISYEIKKKNGYGFIGSPMATREEAEKILAEGTVSESYFINERQDREPDYQKEYDQLKQELERIETEGFGALKPIWNFYENTVTNILNKTYGTVQDYSNTPIKEGVKDLFENNKELKSIGNEKLYSAYLDTIFPDSKVKDIVYHGTNAKFDKFDKTKLGTKTTNKTNQLGFYFSDKKVAAMFNSLLPKDYYNKSEEDLIRLYDKYSELYGKDKAKEILDELVTRSYDTSKMFDRIYLPDSNFIAVIINSKNPLIADTNEFAGGTRGDGQEIADAYKNKTKNNDSIILPALEDGGLGGEEFESDNYVVFEPEQIHILGGKQDIEGFKKFVKEANNPKIPQITDEYGNIWNEITITPKMSETIRLNTLNGKIEYTGDLAIEEKIAEEAYNSKDEKIPTTLIGKFIEFLKNLLRNLFKERDNISRLIRNLNQGRFNLNTSQEQGVRYSINKKVDSRFSPAQLSDVLKPQYRKLMELNNNDELKTQNELLFSSNVIFEKAYVNELGEEVGLFYLKSEENPNFIAMNGSLEKSLDGLRKDFEIIKKDSTLKINSENEEKSVILSPKIDEFYNNLSEEEKEKLGNIEELYNELFYPLSDEEFIDMLKCKL